MTQRPSSFGTMPRGERANNSAPNIASISRTACVGIFATNVLIWSLAADYLNGSPAAATSIAFVNCIGLLSGFCSPFVIGWLKTATGTLVSGLYVMTAILVAGILVMLFGFRHHAQARA